MKKRLLALLLTVAMVASLLVAPAGAVNLPFTDVKEGDWFREAVDFVYDEGIMSGMSATEFGPNRNLTRAQAAQLLYNYEGKPEIKGDAFDDVEQGQWYYNAVNWAAAAGVVSGMGDRRFDPNNDLTREQLVTILMNYAQYKGYDTNASTSLNQFTDAGQVSSWAVSRLQWAVAEKLVNGMGDGTVAPKGTATRAQMAAIMKNFVDRFALPGGHSVSFVTYGGSRVSGQVVAEGNSATEPDVPTQEGASFGAWYTDAEYTRIYQFDTPVTEDLTLYARWNYDNYSLGDYDFDRSNQTLSVGVTSQTDTVLEVRLLDQDSEELLVRTTVNVAPTLAEQEMEDEENVEGEAGLLELTEQQITVLCPDAPEYFVLYLALKDQETGEIYASLNSIHFTEVFEEFQSKTIYDFDEERVLNFDEATDKNFGVLAEGVEILESSDSVNVYSRERSDPDSGIYVFTDIDGSLLDTGVGDILYWPGDYQGLIRVASFDLQGDAIIITAAENNDLTQFYDYLRVDMELDPDAYETTELDPYEEEIMLTEDGDGYYSESWSEDALELNAEIVDVDVQLPSLKASLPISITAKSMDGSVSGSVNASAELSVTPKIVLNWDVRLLEKDGFEIKISTTTKVKCQFEISVKGEAGGTEYEVPAIEKPLKLDRDLNLVERAIPWGIAGLNSRVKVNQGFRVSFTASASATITTTAMAYMGYTTTDGRISDKNITTEKTLSASGKLEIRVGPECTESIEFLNGVVSASLIEEGGVALIITATETVAAGDGETVRHECLICVEMELKAFLEVRAELAYQITDYISGKPFTGTLFSLEVHLADCYLSSDIGFGWGSCSNKSYRVTVSVVSAGESIPDDGILQVRDSNGLSAFSGGSGSSTYLKNGTYTLELIVDGEKTAGKTFEVKSKPMTASILLVGSDEDADDPNTPTDPTNPDNPEDPQDPDDGGDSGGADDPDEVYDPYTPILPEGAVVSASGKCGGYYNKDNVRWVLTEDGLLLFYGEGPMQTYAYTSGTASRTKPWYQYRNSITEVIIQEGVTNTADSLLYGLLNLEKVTLPSSLSGIAEHTFEECTALSTIVIPESVTVIGSYVFKKCTGLTEVIIPNGVIEIRHQAFYGCTGLTSITIPDSVTSIGANAFGNCTGLTDVTIPDSVTSIEGEAFENCTSLISVTIPSGVTSIENNLFEDCTGLISVTIPSSVTSIGKSAFNGCTSLTGITIPDSVTSIGDSAFQGCENLTSATIPDSVTSIGSWGFTSCESLTSIVIPTSVTRIEAHTFQNCSNLTDVYYRGSEEEFEKIFINTYNNGLEGATIHYNYQGV